MSLMNSRVKVTVPGHANLALEYPTDTDGKRISFSVFAPSTSGVAGAPPFPAADFSVDMHEAACRPDSASGKIQAHLAGQPFFGDGKSYSDARSAIAKLAIQETQAIAAMQATGTSAVR